MSNTHSARFIYPHLIHSSKFIGCPQLSSVEILLQPRLLISPKIQSITFIFLTFPPFMSPVCVCLSVSIYFCILFSSWNFPFPLWFMSSTLKYLPYMDCSVHFRDPHVHEFRKNSSFTIISIQYKLIWPYNHINLYTRYTIYPRFTLTSD